MKEYRAKLLYLRIAPRKTRLVADLVRGESAVRARHQLEFSTQRAAVPLLKLLKSALANAQKQDESLDENSLYIKELRVDAGPILHRYRAASRGMVAPIEKKTSHITITLTKREAKPKSKSQKSKIRNKNQKEKTKV